MPRTLCPVIGLLPEKVVASGSMMVALYPPPEIAKQLAIKGGEEAGELHCTLIFLGKKDWTGDELDTVKRIVAQAVALTPPVEASIAGLGIFTEGPDPVLYLSVDAPALPALRQRIFERLKAAGIPPDETHGYTPHLTILYGETPRGYAPPPGVKFKFNDLVVAVGGDHFAAFPLAVGRGERPVAGELGEGLKDKLSALADRRHREHGRFADEAASLMKSYDASKLKFGKSAGGSNGARWADHQDGSRYLVKQYGGDRDRIATELTANAVYRVMGARVPEAGTIKLHNGKEALAYPSLDGAPKPYVFHDGPPSKEVGNHFMTDALLANWDVAGLEDDNILWGKDGAPFRVDQGGTLEYRAMGGTKGFGPVPLEVASLMGRGKQGQRSSAVDGPGMRKQAGEIEATLTPGRIDALIDQAGFEDAAMRERVRENLKARVRWMGRFARGEVGIPLLRENEYMLWEALVGLFTFDHLHPRDAFGKFSNKIGGLNVNQSLALDKKTRIGRDKDGSLRVTRSGLPAKGFLHPDDAARYALDVSAKSKDADSIGGTVAHKGGYNAFLTSVSHDPMSFHHLGGKTHDAASLGAEVHALEFRLSDMKEHAAWDSSVPRSVKSVEARLAEAKTKLTQLKHAEDSFDNFAHGLSDPSATVKLDPTSPYGGLKVGDKVMHDGKERAVTELIPEDHSKLPTYLHVVKLDGGGPVSIGSLDDWPTDGKGDPVVTVAKTLDSSAHDKVGAQNVLDDLKGKEVTFGNPTFRVVPHGVSTDGTKVKVKVTANPDPHMVGQFMDLDPAQFVDAKEWTVTDTLAHISSQGEKVKGPQENKLGKDGAPAAVKDLHLVPGDTIQYQAGGWNLTFVGETQSPGGMPMYKFTTPGGVEKTYSGHKGAESVTKADGSQLALKGAAPPPPPAGMDFIKKFLTPPAAGTMIKDLKDGDVILTPDGKVAIMKPSEPAYQGYVTAHDIETGIKIEAPADKPPYQLSTVSSVKDAAAAEFKKNSTAAPGAVQVSSPSAGPTSTYGPPPQFNAVARDVAAKEAFAKGQGEANLTGAQQKAVSSYTSSSSSINSVTRDTQSVTSLSMAKQITSMDKAMDAKLQEDAVIVRKTTLEAWQGAKAGQVIRDNGYFSASWSENAISQGGVYGSSNHPIEVHVLMRKGSSYVYPDGFGAGLGNEREVILPRGSQFHVLKAETKGTATVLYVELV
jgi:2'-5' RNA ligase